MKVVIRYTAVVTAHSVIIDIMTNTGTTQLLVDEGGYFARLHYD